MNDDRQSRAARIGHGYDIHRFTENRPLVLGGVTIPHQRGLAGHSDADCLSHAVADAILGALALPDIGHCFPDTDPAYAGMNSLVIVRHAAAQARERGYTVGNADLTVIAEEPRIGPHLETMRATLAEALTIPPDCVGIKATTNEKLGSLGGAEGIAAHAVVLLWRTDAPESSGSEIG